MSVPDHQQRSGIVNHQQRSGIWSAIVNMNTLLMHIFMKVCRRANITPKDLFEFKLIQIQRPTFIHDTMKRLNDGTNTILHKQKHIHTITRT